MSESLYPLKFVPILKDKIWGGEKLSSLLNKKGETNTVGESWEISDVHEDTSIVANGSLKGLSLKQLIATYKDKLVGKRVYDVFGDKFPLLIKFIDAKQELSIQLHPNDELASQRHNSFGKTEMWYVMQAEKEAELIIGFKDKTDKETYLTQLESGSLPSILNKEKVNVGDTFFIEVGRVHAIGAGVLLAEIQQTSDITYRLYDWDRKNEDGESRELHTELALDAIDFDMPDDFKVSYEDEVNTINAMVSCQYFTTSYLHISGTIQVTNTEGSFHIYLCVEGQADFKGQGFCESIEMGQTLLMPADLKKFDIAALNAKLLQVYV